MTNNLKNSTLYCCFSALALFSSLLWFFLCQSHAKFHHICMVLTNNVINSKMKRIKKSNPNFCLCTWGIARYVCLSFHLSPEKTFCHTASAHAGSQPFNMSHFFWCFWRHHRDSLEFVNTSHNFWVTNVYAYTSAVRWVSLKGCVSVSSHCFKPHLWGLLIPL